MSKSFKNKIKLNDIVSVKDFGAVGDGSTDDTSAINTAITYIDSLGGGTVLFPAGTYATSTGITLGNGSNSAPSTIHNKITLKGAGYGSSSGVINQQINGASRILYTGTTSATAAVLTLAGPMYGVCIEDLALDCAAKAGRGLIVNHVTQGTFRRVSARNYTTKGFDLTTRTGFPTGCAFGCADNRFYDCYGWLDDASLSAATIQGISLSSGVSTGTSLVSQPDSARNVFIGGTFMYGTTATSYGAWLSGADNNSMLEVEFYPYGGSTSGYDVYFNQWAASGDFPLENYFANLGMTRGISGNSGVGSSNGNTFFPFPTSDGATFPPALTCASGVNHLGQTFVTGVQAYRGRQISQFTSQSDKTTTSATMVDVTGYSITINNCMAASKFLVEYQIRALQATAGTGRFQIVVDGSGQGATYSDIGATGYNGSVTGKILMSGLAAGSHTFKVQFMSDGTHTLHAINGTLTVQELY